MIHDLEQHVLCEESNLYYVESDRLILFHFILQGPLSACSMLGTVLDFSSIHFLYFIFNSVNVLKK